MIMVDEITVAVLDQAHACILGACGVRPTVHMNFPILVAVCMGNTMLKSPLPE